MSGQKKALFIGLLIGPLLFSACRQKAGVKRVQNSRPKIEGTDFVRLQPLHRIDVTEISLFSKNDAWGPGAFLEFDERGNVYLLDPYKCRISVFNDRGQFVIAFGGKGQGPGEFVDPFDFVVGKAAIYVFQGSGMKVVDLEGKYLSSRGVSHENPLGYQHIGDFFYLVSARVGPAFSDLDVVLDRFENEPGGARKRLMESSFAPGFNACNVGVIPWRWIGISESGAFYFPEDNFARFSITGFDGGGDRRIVFGREYLHRPYSDKARKRFAGLDSGIIPGRGKEDPGFPPIVRKIFADPAGNIWVVSGETFEDNQDPDWENAVDIFDAAGTWLNSFKSKSVSADCLYHDGRIYKLSPPDADTLKQYIDVFEIRY